MAENIYINNEPKNKFGIIQWKKMIDDTEAILKNLGISINPKDNVSNLSIGQRQMVEIIKALVSNAKLIVMDEPSATLSKDEYLTLIKVINDLKSKGITIIYISHRLDELFEVGDNITVLRDGKHIITSDIKDINISELVEYMIGKKINNDLISIANDDISDEVILKIKNLNNKKLKNICFDVHKKEIVGLYGLVGSGRTEILRAIFGADSISSGEILYKNNELKNITPRKAINMGIGLLPENRKYQGLNLIFKIWENESIISLNKFTKGIFLDYKEILKTCESYVQKLNIKTPNIYVETNNLSGGNQQKVIFSKWIIKECDLFLIDEPTQGIDVGAKEEIYKIMIDIVKNDKSILIVSSEIEELVKVCNRILVVYDGQIVGEFNDPISDQNDILKLSISGEAK